MLSVLIPIIILLGIILTPKIPVIGGNIQVGLVLTGLSALLMGGICNPVDWGLAWIDGIDRIAWVIALSIFGSIYAETQVAMGTMDTVIRSLRAAFGHSPRGLITVTVIALVLAGSLLGDAIAASTVVGVLVIKSLHELGLKGEQISATIVMGASLGSIMPPITQAIFLSSALVGIEPDPVVNVAYFSVGLGLMICCLYIAFSFIKISALPEDLIPTEKALSIVGKNFATLIPLIVLVLLVVLRTLPPAYKIDILAIVLAPFISAVKGIPILKGLSNLIVLAIISVTAISFLYPSVHKNGGKLIAQGLRNVRTSASIQICAGFMLGAFYMAGQIETVKNLAQGLNASLLKLGGAGALTLIGMLTGSQTTAQNAIFSFFGPALVSVGVDPVKAALAGSHLAMSGQGLPPADLTTFVVAGLVGGILGIKVDPVRSMFYSMVMCIYFLVAGLFFLFW